jgi:hypothetical protein
MRTEYVLGVDLGQVHDYTAATVVEVLHTEPEDERHRQLVFEARRKGLPPPALAPPVYHARHLERWRGLTYPRITAEVKWLMGTLPGPATLVVDGTGVGRAVVDGMREAGLTPKPVTITSGMSVNRGAGGYFRVPKVDLVGVVAVLLQAERLKIARQLSLTPILAEELRTFEVRHGALGRDSFGVAASWRQDAHDDLVLALACALWWAERRGRYDANRYEDARVAGSDAMGQREAE